MTGRDLAREVGITEPMVSYLISGKLLPTAEDLRKICEVLSCKTCDIYQLSDLLLVDPMVDDDRQMAMKMIKEHLQAAGTWMDQIG